MRVKWMGGVISPEPPSYSEGRWSSSGRSARPRPVATLLVAVALTAFLMLSSRPESRGGNGTRLVSPSLPPITAEPVQAAAAHAAPARAAAAPRGAPATVASLPPVPPLAVPAAAPTNTSSKLASAQQPVGLLAGLPVRAAALARMVKRLAPCSGTATSAAAVHAALEAPGAVAPVLEPEATTPDVSSSGTTGSMGSKAVNRGLPVTASGGDGVAVLQGQEGEGECQPNLVVVLTSHKTGTAQAGCITEMLEQRYVMQGATRHDHHPADLHAVSTFAAERLQTQFSGALGGSSHLYCPSVKFYSSGHHLPRLEDEACPGTLPCPCEGEQEQCLSLEAGTIDIPSGNTTVVQVIRNPINAVLSAYQYHTQSPAPEEWLEHMSMQNFSGWMYAGGVPYEALDALGAFEEALPNDSFYSFLRRLPKEQGVKLQFWMSSWELYGFARQYASLAMQPGLRFIPVRFEDLQSRYNTTAGSMLRAFAEHLPQLDVAAMLNEVQTCHVSSWDATHLASHVHVTITRDPHLRSHLRGMLMKDAEIAPRLCQLTNMFGYQAEVPECGGNGGSASNGGK